MTKKNENNRKVQKTRPAMTPEARENQIIAMAIDLAEEQIANGTASSQVITHFLKLGSSRAELEKQKLIEENKLLQAKTDDINNRKRYDELVEEAMNAFKIYSGQQECDINDDEMLY